MPNINITTHPTGRSPENKFFFGEQAKDLDLSRPKFNKIGLEADFDDFLSSPTTTNKLFRAYEF